MRGKDELRAVEKVGGEIDSRSSSGKIKEERGEREVSEKRL